ncbi:MAG: hypothetical protein ACR2O4_07950 [Hyphomicrobiaceae bacterium]
MATIVPGAQAPDRETRELERQIQDLQRKLAEAVKNRSRATQHTEAAVSHKDTDLQRQRRLRKGLLPYLGEYSLLVVLTAPVIYSTFFALVILDVFLTVYQWICFPVYGLEKVKRRDFIVIDRHQLAYLNVLEKLNCVFCGYANGLLAYSAEIASRTEAFWCPIKHAAKTEGLHPRTEEFVSFQDGVGYRLKQQQNGKRAKRAAGRIRQCSACIKRN